MNISTNSDWAFLQDVNHLSSRKYEELIGGLGMYSPLVEHLTPLAILLGPGVFISAPEDSSSGKM